jgi:ribonuclease P protein component
VKRKFRITRSSDFKRVRRLGKSYTHPLIALVTLQSENENPRVGFVTGKSIGNAVVRNRIKRQLRAILTDFLPFFLKKFDIVIIAREPIRKATSVEINDLIKQLLTKAKIINPNEYDARRPTS